MKKHYFFKKAILCLVILTIGLVSNAQVTYEGNNQSGFGDVIGTSDLTINHDATNITFTLSQISNSFNNVMVVYISNGSDGRKIIDASDQDEGSGGDALRRAITNFGSPNLQFSPGFEVTHAIAISDSYGALFSVPSSGAIGNNGLTYVNVNGDNSTIGDADGTNDFSFIIKWSDIGLTSSDNFGFVVTYGNPNDAGGMFSSNEAYGDGLGGTNPGTSSGITYSTYFDYPSGSKGGNASTAQAGSWSTTSTWANGNTPLPFDVVTIANDVTVDTNGTVGDIVINNGQTLTINANQSITTQRYAGEVTGANIDNSNGGTLIANSGASLIIAGSLSGNLTYNRNLPSDNWYLITSPVNGETVTDFMAAHSLATGITNTANRGLGRYQNNGTNWNYYQNGYAGADLLNDGVGFAVKLTAAADISFTGSVPATTDVDIAMDSETNGFNLLGNPYPAYIPANTAADANNNILKINDVDNDRLTEATIWFWDAASQDYQTVNLGSTARFIDPAQGFFVSSNGSNNFRFTQNMRSHQTGNTFQKANTIKSINLIASNGGLNKKTEIYFNNNATKGFDNGYDSSMFNLNVNGNSNSFAIYTELIDNNTGKKLAIQSLSDSDIGAAIVPVGITAKSGQEIVFTAEALNLPIEQKVFLEDRDNNNFIRLDEANSNYKVVLDKDLNGTGRFYLHSSSSALSTDDIALSGVSIFATNKNTLRINGVNSFDASLKVFNILGKKVLDASFASKGVTDVNLPNLTTGVYIVQLNTEKGKISKKIVLE